MPTATVLDEADAPQLRASIHFRVKAEPAPLGLVDEIQERSEGDPDTEGHGLKYNADAEQAEGDDTEGHGSKHR